ncbi:MAG: 4Fe-4S binding protein [bacterium]|nr:MAG: 4Fe-4S binding protein [bacterium]
MKADADRNTVKGSGFGHALLRKSWPWAAARLAAIAALAGVLASAWGRRSIPGVEAADPLMYTNLGNLAFWVFWLMGLVLLAPVLGRAWCGVCPVGTANEVISRFGAGKAFPRILRNQHLKAAVLLATVLLIGLARIHHYPSATAWYLAAWVAGAVALGAVFAGRSLCAYVCPVGGMLGLYGRTAPFRFGVREDEVCRRCEGKECVRGASHWLRLAAGRLRATLRLRRHPCPVSLKVWDMGGSDRCLTCFNCLRACPLDNVAVLARRPFSGLWQEDYPRFSDSVLTGVLAGFILLSFSRFWPASEAVLSSPVAWLAPLTGPLSRPLYLVWMGFGLPMLLFLLPAVMVHWSRVGSEGGGDGDPAGDGPPLRLWMEDRIEPGGDGQEERVRGTDTVLGISAAFAPALVPMLLASHMVLALVKINAKSGYLPLAVADPAGVTSYMAVAELGTVARPGLLLPLGLLRGIAVLLVTAGAALSLAAHRKIGAGRGMTAGALYLPHAVLSVVVFGGLLRWLF